MFSFYIVYNEKDFKFKKNITCIPGEKNAQLHYRVLKFNEQLFLFINLIYYEKNLSSNFFHSDPSLLRLILYLS